MIMIMRTHQVEIFAWNKVQVGSFVQLLLVYYSHAGQHLYQSNFFLRNFTGCTCMCIPRKAVSKQDLR